MDAFGGMIRQAGEYVGKPGLRIDVVELGGGNQRVDRSGAPAALIGASEGPVLSPEGNGRSWRSAALFDMQRRPSSRKRVKASQRLRAVVDRFGRVAVFGEPGTLFAQPSLQFDDQWPATLLAQAHALLWHEAVDLALDGEQDIDALDRLGGNRRLAEPRQVKELTPCMRPARGFDDQTDFAVGFVELGEARVGVGRINPA